MAAGRPYKITATADPSNLANQLNRELGRISRDISNLSSQMSAGNTVTSSPTATSAPAAASALAAVQAQVTAIQALLRPMTVQGSAISSGSVLTSQLGVPATTGAPLWAISTPIAAGQQIRPTGAPANGNLFFQAANSGTTGAAEPSWNTEDGATTGDNGITWVQSGLAANTPIGPSSFANIKITGTTLFNNVWSRQGVPLLYMGDINGPILVGVNLGDTTFTAGQTVDIDVLITIPTVSGNVSFDSASRVTLTATNSGGFIAASFSLVTTSAMVASTGFLGAAIPGNVTVQIFFRQATGGSQTINVGTVYVAMQHS